MYNCYMKLKSKELIKVLLSQRGFKLKELAKILTEKTGKEYSPDGLSHKIGRGTISYDEMLVISEILGYEINITETNL